MTKPRILVADPISDIGVEELKNDPNLEVDVKHGLSEDELVAIAGDYSGIIVRSQTKITEPILEAAKQLKAVGRAGVGVDNIDIPAATARGVIVMNTPTGNTISTAEHAFTLMMSLARNIGQADASMRAGKWERKKFGGVELYNKTLAILGMGRIGSEFARRAMAFGMRVVAYDPFLSEKRARLMSVELLPDLDDALKRADFITLHMPLTDDTRHLINAENAKLLKPDIRIINCARGGLLDEAAIGRAIEEGRVAGVALDVYETEPPPEDFAYFKYANTVLTPHLGASTQEAQENVGIEIARTIRDLVLTGAVVNAVNMPSIDEKTAAQIGPYVNFAETLGRILSQLAPKSCDHFRITYSGKVADLETNLISRSALKGFLERAMESVNTINAPSVAESRGIRFTESRSPDLAGFTELIEVSAGTDDEESSVAGTFYGTRARIVKVGERIVEVESEGTLLMIENTDAPGTVGTIGSLLGKHQVNIANMSLNRDAKDGVALTLFNLDSEPSAECVKELQTLEGLQSVKVLRV